MKHVKNSEYIDEHEISIDAFVTLPKITRTTAGIICFPSELVGELHTDEYSSPIIYFYQIPT